MYVRHQNVQIFYLSSSNICARILSLKFINKLTNTIPHAKVLHSVNNTTMPNFGVGRTDFINFVICTSDTETKIDHTQF